MSCAWLLNNSFPPKADCNPGVTVTVKTVGLGVGDYLTLYDGASLSADVLGRLTGAQVPSTALVSTGTAVLVLFESNTYDQADGFSLAYEMTCAERNNCHPYGSLDSRFSGPNTTGQVSLTSRQTRSEQLCFWSVVNPFPADADCTPVVRLVFDLFDLELNR